MDRLINKCSKNTLAPTHLYMSHDAYLSTAKPGTILYKRLSESLYMQATNIIFFQNPTLRDRITDVNINFLVFNQDQFTQQHRSAVKNEIKDRKRRN